MRKADTVLGIIRERGSKGLPLERVYRLMFNRDLFLVAYGKIAQNAGAMTPGATAETPDGMSRAKIDALIEALRFERYRWTPVRRVYIPKSNGKMRPLGVPTWSDKLVQEVLRMILEAYYEPQFSDHSHGFRPNRGCHTALRAIHRRWNGTTWFIEGDISGYFDSISHEILLGILAEKIHDDRFIRLIGDLLKAGYLEDWKLGKTLSGTPQGGIVSPVLANLYLDRLDQWVETTLLPSHNRGIRREYNPTYTRTNAQAHWLRKKGAYSEAARLHKATKQLPSYQTDDPAFRRLRYVRYADDFLLGFVGPRSEAEEIKRKLGEFLRDSLKLELSQAKTLITHARTSPARFLGYELSVLQANDARTRNGRRRINGVVGLRAPRDVLKGKCARFLSHGKPVHLLERTHDSPYSIVALYQQEYRGIVEYYRLAYNLHRFNRLKWVMEQSLTKTLASKLRISVATVYDRYATVLPTSHGPRKGLRVVVEREGKKPLVAEWGGITLKRDLDAALDDQPRKVWNAHTELQQRLVANQCELCGSRVAVQVHHIRALKDLKQPGRAAKPEWVKQMAARHRKTLVVCRPCHQDIHLGRPPRHKIAESKTPESRMT